MWNIMKHLSFNTTISVLDAEMSALGVTGDIGAEFSEIAVLV